MKSETKACVAVRSRRLSVAMSGLQMILTITYNSISSSVTSLGSHMRYACADRVFTFARVVQSIQLQVLFMENFDSEKQTAEVSSGQSEEDNLFAKVDID